MLNNVNAVYRFIVSSGARIDKKVSNPTSLMDTPQDFGNFQMEFVGMF